MKRGLIPWREVRTWECTACGRCCIGYRVPLKMDEYIRITKLYGYDVVEVGMGKVYLRRGPDNRCVFLRPILGRWVCTLQSMKPLACKLYPFRIYMRPLYNREDGSAYNYKGKTLHIYLDPHCEGIRPGRPSEHFVRHILPEVVEIGLGLRWKQRYTTSRLIHWPP